MTWTASVMTASASCTGRFLASMPMMQTATYSRRQDDDVVYLFPGENGLEASDRSGAASRCRFEEMLIPDVECWLPGDLPLDLVHEVLTTNAATRIHATDCASGSPTLNWN